MGVEGNPPSRSAGRRYSFGLRSVRLRFPEGGRFAERGVPPPDRGEDASQPTRKKLPEIEGTLDSDAGVTSGSAFFGPNQVYASDPSSTDADASEDPASGGCNGLAKCFWHLSGLLFRPVATTTYHSNVPFQESNDMGRRGMHTASEHAGVQSQQRSCHTARTGGKNAPQYLTQLLGWRWAGGLADAHA